MELLDKHVFEPIPTVSAFHVTMQHDEMILDIRKQDEGQKEGAQFVGM